MRKAPRMSVCRSICQGRDAQPQSSSLMGTHRIFIKFPAVHHPQPPQSWSCSLILPTAPHPAKMPAGNTAVVQKSWGAPERVAQLCSMCGSHPSPWVLDWESGLREGDL